MFASLSPDNNLIKGCRQDCPLLDSCRAQGLKRCHMQMRAVTISLPLVDSLLLHAIVVALVLMLPIYGGSAGQRPFMSYLVSLTNGEGSVPSPGVIRREKNNAVNKVVAQEAPVPKKEAPQKKAEVEKAIKTPENVVSPSPVEKTARTAVPQNIPPKTENVKTDTQMAEEVVKEPKETVSDLKNVPPNTEEVATAEMAEEEVAEPPQTRTDEEVEKEHESRPRTISQKPPESSAPSRPTGTPPSIARTEQLMKKLLPDTGALLSYQGRSEATSPEGEKKEAPEGTAAKQTGNEVTVPPSPATEGIPETAPGGRQVAEGGASSALGQGGKAGGTVPAVQQQTANEEKKAPIGISGAAALLPRDIMIRVVVAGEDGSSLFTRLSRRTSLENVGGKDSPVKAQEEKGSAGGNLVRRVLSVVNADKGIYTFVIGNAGSKTIVVNTVFLLFERTKRERSKDYKVIRLAPGTGVKFKFLVPDAIFWDDDDRFTGSMEDSDSITKFNSDTGLVWKEEKDD
jgi:hypothetical protein